MKKYLVPSLLLALILLVAGCIPIPRPEPAPIQGDVNGDGVLNMGDVIKLELIMAGKAAETPGADVNGDGVVNIGDLIKCELLVRDALIN